MTPEATFQPFPTSTFSTSSSTIPSSTLNSRNRLAYDFLLKDPKESYYRNPRYDLFSQPQNNLLYSYYPNFYQNNNFYSSSTDYLINNRRNIYGFNHNNNNNSNNNSSNMSYLNSSINSFVFKDQFTNPFDNLLGSTTCSSALKGTSLLSEELLHQTDINTTTTDLLSPLLLPETKYDEKITLKKGKDQSTKLEMDKSKHLKKEKKEKYDTITESIEQLTIEDDKKLKLKLKLKNKTKKGKNKNNDLLTINTNYNSPQKLSEDKNTSKEMSFSLLSSEPSISSPLLALAYSPSSINTPPLDSPCSSFKSISFDDLTSNSTSSEDYQSCSKTNPNIYLNSFSGSNSTTNCSSPISNLSSSCSSSASSSIIHLPFSNKKPKRKGGNSKGRKRPNHPHKVTRILKEWLASNSYPYPSNTEKSRLCDATGLTMLNNWFINARRRYI